MQRKFDVMICNGQTPEQLRDMVEQQFGVVAAVSGVAGRPPCRLVVDGTEAQLREVERWHTAL